MATTESGGSAPESNIGKSEYRKGSLTQLNDEFVLACRIGLPAQRLVRLVEEIPSNVTTPADVGQIAREVARRPTVLLSCIRRLWPQPNYVFYYASVVVIVLIAVLLLGFVSGLPVPTRPSILTLPEGVIDLDPGIPVLFVICAVVLWVQTIGTRKPWPFARLVPYSFLQSSIVFSTSQLVSRGPDIAAVFSVIPWLFDRLRLEFTTAARDVFLAMLLIVLLTEPRVQRVSRWNGTKKLGLILVFLSVLIASLIVLSELRYDGSGKSVSILASVLVAMVAFWVLTVSVGAWFAARWRRLLGDTALLQLALGSCAVFVKGVPTVLFPIVTFVFIMMELESIILQRHNGR